MPDTKGQILYDSTYMSYLEQLNSETEGRTVVSRGWGRREWEVIVLWVQSFNLGRLKFLVIDGDVVAQQRECS